MTKFAGLLRKFASNKTFIERCALCASSLAPVHDHLVERGARGVLCCCPGCGLLFQEEGARYQRVPRDVKRFSAFDLPEELWDRLEVPVDLMFFQKNGATGKIAAFYPSPAGALDSLLPFDAWQELERRNPALAAMRADVEALLVHRVKGAREYFLAPVDECFKLIGLIRFHWRGISGGDEVWEKAREFFAELGRRADEL